MFEADIKAKKGSQLQLFKELNSKTKTPTLGTNRKLLEGNKSPVLGKKSPKLTKKSPLIVKKSHNKSISNLP